MRSGSTVDGNTSILTEQSEPSSLRVPIFRAAFTWDHPCSVCFLGHGVIRRFLLCLRVITPQIPACNHNCKASYTVVQNVANVAGEQGGSSSPATTLSSNIPENIAARAASAAGAVKDAAAAVDAVRGAAASAAGTFMDTVWPSS